MNTQNVYVQEYIPDCPASGGTVPALSECFVALLLGIHYVHL